MATAVARHKSSSFIEKDAEGQARTALAEDYAAMLADELMVGNAVSFEALLEAGADPEAKVNRVAV